LALWLAGGRGGRPPLLLSATAFGVAIAGMHYTAMAGLTVFPHGSPSSGAPALSTDLLAIVVAVVAFVVSGIFLLALVPERAGAAVVAAGGIAASAALTEDAGVTGEAAASAAAAADGTDVGHGTFAPLGGAGGPPRRLARHLPIERDGATHFLSVEHVVAVHANAHYTYVFDGRSKLFCPLAIGDVESRLDTGRFARVHRSHIVNIDRIVGLKRAGDNGLIELASEEEHYTVPVSRSRSRIGWLKSRLGERTGEVLS